MGSEEIGHALDKPADSVTVKLEIEDVSTGEKPVALPSAVSSVVLSGDVAGFRTVSSCSNLVPPQVYLLQPDYD